MRCGQCAVANDSGQLCHDAIARSQSQRRCRQPEIRHGELGNLRRSSTQSGNAPILDAAGARNGQARFPGQTVKLHQEFQVGVNTPHDSALFWAADIISLRA